MRSVAAAVASIGCLFSFPTANAGFMTPETKDALYDAALADYKCKGCYRFSDPDGCTATCGGFCTSNSSSPDGICFNTKCSSLLCSAHYGLNSTDADPETGQVNDVAMILDTEHAPNAIGDSGYHLLGSVWAGLPLPIASWLEEDGWSWVFFGSTSTLRLVRFVLGPVCEKISGADSPSHDALKDWQANNLAFDELRAEDKLNLQGCDACLPLTKRLFGFHLAQPVASIFFVITVRNILPLALVIMLICVEVIYVAFVLISLAVCKAYLFYVPFAKKHSCGIVDWFLTSLVFALYPSSFVSTAIVQSQTHEVVPAVIGLAELAAWGLHFASGIWLLVIVCARGDFAGDADLLSAGLLSIAGPVSNLILLAFVFGTRGQFELAMFSG